MKHYFLLESTTGKDCFIELHCSDTRSKFTHLHIMSLLHIQLEANGITSSASSLVDNLNGPNGIQKINTVCTDSECVYITY